MSTTIPGPDGAVAAPSGPAPGQWRVVIPAPEKWLNANDHTGHWGKRQRLADAWRQAAAWRIRAAKLPRLRTVHVVAHLNLNPMPPHYDPANWHPTAKAAVDGLVDAGVVPDDCHHYLTGPDMRPGSPTGTRDGELVLVITGEEA